MTQQWQRNHHYFYLQRLIQANCIKLGRRHINLNKCCHTAVKQATYVTVLLVVVSFISQPVNANYRAYNDTANVNERLLSQPGNGALKNDTILGERDVDSDQRVVEGRAARFKCVVHNLNDKTLSWFSSAKRTLLAANERVVAPLNGRLQVSQQANSVYYLQIDNVKLSDQGQITCKVNTNPPLAHTYQLDVVQSPQIRDAETTTNVEPVKEFSPVELRCAADGVPKPTIKWRKISQVYMIPTEAPPAEVDNPTFEKQKQDDSNDEGRQQRAPREATTNGNLLAEGATLRIERVTRNDMGIYICIASNGVPPSVSQRIFLPVIFTPPSEQTTETTATETTKAASAVTTPLSSDQTKTHRTPTTIDLANNVNQTTNATLTSHQRGKGKNGKWKTPPYKHNHQQQQHFVADRQPTTAASNGSNSSATFVPHIATLATFVCLTLLHCFVFRAQHSDSQQMQ